MTSSQKIWRQHVQNLCISQTALHYPWSYTLRVLHFAFANFFVGFAYLPHACLFASRLLICLNVEFCTYSIIKNLVLFAYLPGTCLFAWPFPICLAYLPICLAHLPICLVFAWQICLFCLFACNILKFEYHVQGSC